MRRDRQAVEAVLDQLDHSEEGGAGRDIRCSIRQSYREVVRVELEQPAGNSVCYVVYTRNISCSGIGFLAGQFIYPRTRCKVHLADPHGNWHAVKGIVARCRYLPGTVSLHEVGVSFRNAFDLALLEPDSHHTGRGRVLLVAEDAAVYDLAQLVLEELGARVTRVPTGGAAIDAAMASRFDLVLLDLDLPDMDGLSAVEALRARGYERPIVAVTASEDEVTRSACRNAGCTSHFSKPVSAEAVRRAMNEITGPPLTSSMASQPEMAELIDQFVARLPDKIARLERAFDARNFALLAGISRVLKGEGPAYGFNSISVAATELEHALHSRAGDAVVRYALDKLINRCAAPRPVAATLEAD